MTDRAPDDSVPTYGRSSLPATEDLLGGPIASLDDDRTHSDADDIEAELNEQVLPTETFPVPGRPRYSVTYRLDFEQDDLRRWEAGAKVGKRIDGRTYSGLVLGATCTAILRDGEPIITDGKVATFTERGFLEQVLKVDRAVDAVHKLYGLEGNADAAARAVLAAAGWGADLEPVGPTRRR